jgi:hypothetical protein
MRKYKNKNLIKKKKNNVLRMFLKLFMKKKLYKKFILLKCVVDFFFHIHHSKENMEKIAK